MQHVREQILPQYQALRLRAQVVLVSAFGGAVNNDIQFWIGGPDLAKLDLGFYDGFTSLSTTRVHELAAALDRGDLRPPHRPGQSGAQPAPFGQQPQRQHPGEPDQAIARVMSRSLIVLGSSR